MCDQILCDLFAPIFIKNILSRKPDSIDHSLCAYDKIRVSDSFLTLLRQSLRASHADSEKCDLLFSGKSVAFDQHMPAFPQRQTLFCERSSDDHNSCTTGFGRLDLLKKPPALPESLVTRYLHSYCVSIARFIPWKKVPASQSGSGLQNQVPDRIRSRTEGTALLQTSAPYNPERR